MTTRMEDAPELELRHYVSVLRRRKWIVALTAIGVLAVAMAATFAQTPKYAATARVLLQQRSTDILFNENSGQQNDPSRSVQTEIQVIVSKPVRDRVQARLGQAATVVPTAVGQTNVIAIRSVSTSPQRAAEVANAYADAYITTRRQQTVDDLLVAIGQIQSKITELDKQIAAIDEKVDPSKRSALVNQRNAFSAKLDETKVDSALQTGGVRLVNPAETPASPYSPTPARNAMLALVLGLVLGAAVAFGLEYFDDSIKTTSDLDSAVDRKFPTRALIPLVSAWKYRDEAEVVSVLEPNSPAAEAYRSLRTNLQYINLDKPVQVIQITSPSEGEGKTTTLANLGVALAITGQRVLLVCADLRRPRLHEFFALENSLGLTSVILGKSPLSGAVQPVPSNENLFVLSSGPLAPNPSELLNTQRTRDVIHSLRSHFDVVLLDCPPVLPVTDAAVLSRHVDTTLVVAMAGSTTQREMARALELLAQVDAPVAGTVLNGVDEVGGYRQYRYDAYVGPSGNGQSSGTMEEVIL